MYSRRLTQYKNTRRIESYARESQSLRTTLLYSIDDVNMLGKNLQTVRGNTDIFIKASKDICFEVNSEKTKYVIISRHQNVVQKHHQSVLPRAGHSLQVQEPKLQFCRRKAFHRKFRNQGWSFTRDWISVVASPCFPHPTPSLASEQTLKDLKRSQGYQHRVVERGFG